MNWIERAINRDRDRGEAQRQKQAREEERSEAQRRVRESKALQKLFKDFAGLVRSNTGKKVDPPPWLQEIGPEKLEGPKEFERENRTIYGIFEVDGVRFGIADATYGADPNMESADYVTKTNLIVFGKPPQVGEGGREVLHYRAIINNSSQVSNGNAIGLGQALRELGYAGLRR